jgi:protein TonB
VSRTVSAKHPPNLPSRLPAEREVDDGRARLAAGPLASLETTLPPTPLRDLLAADGASVYVYSNDESLLRTAEEAAGEHFPVAPVRAWPALLRSIGGKCRIVLVDADAVPHGLERALTELENTAVTPIVLVAATREQSQRLIGLLSERRIHRLLIKPAAVGITRLLLESAITRYLQLREGQAEAAESPPFAAVARAGSKRRRSGALWSAAAVAAAVAVGAAALFVLGVGPFRDSAPGSDAPSVARSGGGATGRAGDVTGPAGTGADATRAVTGSASAVTAPSGVVTGPDAGGAAVTAAFAGPFGDRLRAARLAEQEGRVAAPAGESALDAYASILSEDPGNAAANARLNALLEQLFGEAEADLLSGDLDKAAVVLENVRRVQPSSGRLSFLDVQLANARESQGAAGRADAAAANETGSPAGASSADAADFAGAAGAADTTAPASELSKALALGRSRLEAARLLEPRGDSARAYLDRAASLAPDDPGVLNLKADLATSVTVAARAAIEAGDLERAGSMTDEAARLGANARAVASLRSDLEAAAQRQEADRRAELLADTDQRLAGGQIIAPTEDSALHYLAALQALEPPVPDLAARWTLARRAVRQRVQEAIVRGDWQTAETWTAALEAVDPAPQTASDLRGALTIARRQQEYLATPASPSDLRLIEAPPLEYPLMAERRGIEGWVDLDFVVGIDGRPHDIRITGAQPRTAFDSAATKAVAGQRYEPFVQDGHTYERRVQLRVTFHLQ